MSIPVSIKLGKFFPVLRVAFVVHHQVLYVIDIHAIRFESLVQRIYKFLEGGNFLLKFFPVLSETRQFCTSYIEQLILLVANLHFSAMEYRHFAIRFSIQLVKVFFSFNEINEIDHE